MEGGKEGEVFRERGSWWVWQEGGWGRLGGMKEVEGGVVF